MRPESLFEEARAAAGSGESAAPLWLTIAQTEARALPRDAVRDATRAFDLALTPQQRQVQMMAVAVVARAGRPADAIALARRGNAPCAVLMSVIVPRLAPKAAVDLAVECRKKDGSYPYLAMAERAYAAPATSSERKMLIDHTLEAVVTDTTTEGRAEANAFLLHGQSCNLIAPEQLLRARAYTARPVTMTKEPVAPPTCLWDNVVANPYADLTRISNPAVRSLSPADLEHEVATARGYSTPRDRVQALLAIAGGLVGSER